jgi:hypothetical protein
MSRLECKESIADLWGFPDARIPRKPSTQELFKAIAGEAVACLNSTKWDERIQRIENILSVIKSRMIVFRMEQDQSELDRLVKDKEVDENVGQ